MTGLLPIFSVNLIPTPEEVAERLAAKLRELNIDPENL